MKWFEGPIPEAIKSAKEKGAVFVVYIYGNDELSTQMHTTWTEEQIVKAIDNSGAVPIRILNTSEECKFFSQIYPVVCVPSTFFIGEEGVPLEVTGGHVSPDDFAKKIEMVLKAHEEQKKKISSAFSSKPLPVGGSSTGGTTQDEPVSEQIVQASTSQETQEIAAGGGTEKKALNERVERAKELIEKKREEKAQKELEKSLNQEIERRKLGQGLQKLKEKQAETEMKELKEQMRKDKEEQRKAKEKIRQQIEQDRLDRKAKFSKEKEEREKAQEEAKKARLQEQQKIAAQEEAARSTTARILVRLPDGSSITTTFSSSETLQALYDAVSQRLRGSLVLSTTFPKRRFTPEDMNRTFTDLQLAPTASVIALPAARADRGVVQASSNSFLSLLLYPFMFVWNFLYSMFFGAGTSSTSSSQQRRVPAEQGQTPSNSQTTAYQRRTHVPRQDGNIRRLTDVRDDDEDMSTYNGNSTQQL